jgi:D-alanine-D-alanine ligase
MKIGITYDLRSEYLSAGFSEEETAEFDRDDTVDAIESALQQLGHQTQRIGHVRALAAQLAAGQRWDLTFNIAEGMYGLAREAQVPALLDAYSIAYTFSDPLIMALSLHKDLTKSVVSQAGVRTANGFVVECQRDLERCPLSFPLFAKPVAEGTGKGIDAASVVNNLHDLRTTCASLLKRFQQPVLVEQFLGGREFTVGILGTNERAEILGTLEITLRSSAEANVYSYVNKERCEELVEYEHAHNTDSEVAAAEQIALLAWKALGCRDAGRVDVRSDDQGRPHFLEVNPLAGLHPFHSDLPMICTAVGMPYVQLIERIVTSAAERVETARRRAAALDRLDRSMTAEVN